MIGPILQACTVGGPFYHTVVHIATKLVVIYIMRKFDLQKHDLEFLTQLGDSDDK